MTWPSDPLTVGGGIGEVLKPDFGAWIEIVSEGGDRERGDTENTRRKVHGS
jgi:hypothetical protein